MKKIGIFCAALLALGFTACDDTSDLGKMQINGQEPVMEAGGIGISYQDGFETGSLNLAGTEGQQLDLLTWNVTQDGYTLPEDFLPFFRLRVATDQNFSDEIDLDLTASETDSHKVLVDADDLNDAVIDLVGREPVARKLWIAVQGYLVNGTQLTLLSNELGLKEITVVPALDAAYEHIEPVYYLKSNVGGTVKMLHSDKHQYDDPVFSYVLDVTEDDLTSIGGNVTWEIIPESVSNTQSTDGVLGVAAGTPADTLTGDLVVNGEAGQLSAASKYLIVFNALENTYNISYAADELYVWPSNWNRACLLTTDDNVHFSGAATLTGNWKLTAQKDFKGLQFGTSRTADEGTLVAGNTSLPITVETKGLVWMDVDLAALTYKIQTAETLGLVGNMTGWGETSDIEMTPNADFNIWTATVTFPENGDFKIRANSSWDGLNFGGDMDDLNYGGANLTCEPGTYDVTLTIGYDHVYTLKMVKK